MCLIVDANLASVLFLNRNHEDYAPVWRANAKGKRFVYGGHLADEYHRINAVRVLVLELERAGRARQVPHKLVADCERVVRRSRVLVSDDPHIIALAQVSGARVLCSNDAALGTDFTNPRLLKRPRGAIYRNASHKHLLRRPCRCDPRR